MLGEPAIEQRFEVVGPERQGAVVARERVVEPIEPMQGDAAIAQRLDVVRAQSERPVVARQRVFEPLKVVQNDTAVGPRLGVIRAQRERAVVACQRRLFFVQRGLDEGEKVKRIKTVGSNRDDSPAKLLGLDKLSRAV